MILKISRRELQKINVAFLRRSTCALNQLLEVFHRLHTAKGCFSVGNEGGHSTNSQFLCLPLVRQYALQVLILIKRLS
jgi:hypothetical protein